MKNIKAMTHKKWLFISLVSGLCIIIASIVFAFIINKTSPEVTDFESCVKYSGVVLESFPRQCKAANGQIYTENVIISDPVSNEPDVVEQKILIFFSQNPKSLSDFSYTATVERTSNRTDIATYALEQLINGPSDEEQRLGLFSPLYNKLSGESNCGGPDFSLVINTEEGKGLVKFCKKLETAGVGEDALIKETITQALKQFPSIHKITILNADGNCFGDLSGENQCLR